MRATRQVERSSSSKALWSNQAIPSPRRPVFFWIFLPLAAIVLCGYVYAAVLVARYGGQARDWGWESAPRSNGDCEIVEVDANGPAAGKLQKGDRIVAIDGDTHVRGGMRWTGPIWLRQRTIPPSQPYVLRVARDGGEREIELTAPLVHDGRNLGSILSVFATAFVFFLNGTILGFFKPHERIVQIASLSSLATGLITLANALDRINVFFHGAELVVYLLIAAELPLHLATSYHFSYRFPPGAPKGRLWTGLMVLLYAWAAILFVPFRWMHVAILSDETAAAALISDHAALFTPLRKLYDALVLSSLLATCVVVGRNYRRVREPDEKRRIRSVVLGLVVGVFPWLAVGLSRVVLPSGFRYEGEAYFFANVALAVIPITTGYAIIRHRAFDIRVVVRRGLQYLLAKGVLLAVLVLELAAVAYAVSSDRALTLGEIVTRHSAHFYLFAATALTLVFRGRLSTWIDRRFFRGAYQSEQILLGLVEEVKKLESLSGISRVVSNRVESALHPKGVFVFYREAEKPHLTLGHSSGGATTNQRIQENTELVRLLENEENAMEYPFRGRRELPEVERAWLAELGITLIVPICGTDHHLLGILFLGEKKSEQPYTHNDKKLLEAIAGQMAVVQENALLKSHVDRERKIKHEVLARLGTDLVNIVHECPHCGACYDSQTKTCEVDGAELQVSLPVERTIEGKYRLERLLGKGGMGAVYEATDLRLQRQVALKVMLGGMFGDRDSLHRFEREARASARLNHPNIITVYDYGRTGAEGAFLVMELVRGFTLRRELTRTGAIEPARAAAWLEQILDGIHAAHRAGVVHRDLKPENVLVTQTEKGTDLVKILDFGIAKFTLAERTDLGKLTTPGVLLGTLGYMSPEQLEGKTVDRRSDVFTLGVIVVEILTGRRPFEGTTYTELLSSLTRTRYRLPGDDPKVLELDRVLQRCLAIDPAARFDSVDELQKALIPAVRDCPPFPTNREPIGEAETLAHS